MYFEKWNTVNTLFNQYLLALGEFGLDSMSAGSPNMVVVVGLFIAATFLTQVTIFNMLIAIMGDTFGKVTEIKEQSGLKEKINILADFVWIIPDDETQSRYVYSMQPKTQTEEESNGWEGTVTTIKKVIAQSNKSSRDNTKRDISSVEQEVKNTQKSVKILEDRCSDLTNLAQKQLQQSDMQMTMMRDIQKRLDEREADQGLLK